MFRMTRSFRRMLADRKAQLFFAALSTGVAANAPGQVLINEYVGSTPSSDWEYIELFNAGGSQVDLSGWSIELWDADNGGTFGGSDGGSPYVIPATTTLDASGKYLFANSLAENGFGVSADFQLPSNAIENSSFTMLLKDSLGGIMDSLLVVNSASELGNANDNGVSITPANSIGPSGTFVPGGAHRGTGSTPGDGGLDWIETAFNSTQTLSAQVNPESVGVTVSSSNPFRAIYEIQGSGSSSPFANTDVETIGIVTNLTDEGFFIQDATGDADTATSDGIFVFTDSTPTVSVGQEVEVSGTIAESFSRTQIGGVSLAVNPTGNNGSINSIAVALPAATTTSLERYEGMLIDVTGPNGDPLILSEYFNLDRFGEVRLTTALAQQFSDENVGNVTGYAAHVDTVERSSITIDDNRGGSNNHPIPLVGDPLPPANDPVKIIRRGDEFTNVTGVLDYAFGDYKIQPTAEPVITSTNPRPTGAPSVSGSLKVATFNLQNYFNGDGAGGGFPTDRGARTAADFSVQTDKFVAAINNMGADIIGLQELENDGDEAISSVESLVAALNADLGSNLWSFVDTGTVGTDVIGVGFIYRNDRVVTSGSHAVLDITVDPNFITGANGNRPAIAQTFTELSSGESLTLVNNHLKSKRDDDATGLDLDQNDGQGAYNERRRLAAAALASWIATDPTASGDSDYLVMGDLNAYAMEAPILELEANGYTDLLELFEGSDAYTYIFDGQSGYLDHMLANPALLSQVADLDIWHINADEPDVYDYNTGFGKDAAYTSLGEFRTSDHDPVIIGLNLVPEPSSLVLLSLSGLALLRRRNG